MNNDDDRIFFLRTGTGFNLSICATLLFVVVFSHIGARQKIATQEIIYLECFYIVMYFVILWVALNAILMSEAGVPVHPLRREPALASLVLADHPGGAVVGHAEHVLLIRGRAAFGLKL